MKNLTEEAEVLPPREPSCSNKQALSLLSELCC